MKFQDYNIAPEIKQNLEELGFKRPTDIQFKAIPNILKGEDLLAIAQTGTGKTAAFAIPIVNMIHQQKRNKTADSIKCIVMVPTHELAIQIRDVFDKIAAHTKVKAYSIFGGVAQDPQIAQLEKGIDILIATPGRVFDLVSQGHLNLRQIEILVLDEADHMLKLGFYEDIQDLIRFLPKRRQTLFFSATINERIKDLAYSLVKNAIRIQISPKDPVSKNVIHTLAYVEMDDKRFFLERIITENPDKKILVFVRTKVRAERVSKAMQRVGIETLTIHSDKDQQDRVAVMKQFREGTTKVLIATDISARGIDIPHIDFVVNYDLPDEAENYVHRVGRTGRGVEKGRAVSFCSTEEIPMLKKIEAFMGKQITVMNITKTEYAETLTFTADPLKNTDWKSLMAEAEKAEQADKRKKKPKKVKKK
jgi:ATP-dependent RNA helicase RhlE